MQNLKDQLRHCGVHHVVVWALLLALPLAAEAEPYHEPTIDGVITADGVDWAPLDNVAEDSHDTSPASRNVQRIWCTWDQDMLYLGVTYQDFVAGEALSIFVDLDRDLGPETAENLTMFPGNFSLPTDHGFELVLGRTTDGNFDDVAPTAWLATDSDGTLVSIDADITSAQAFNTSGNKNRFPLWNHVEFGLPWSIIYPDEETTVPINAVVKAVALITMGTAAGNGWDSAPDNDGLDGGTSNVLLSNLAASIIDADGDGAPDPADATISGTVSLPNDLGTAPVTVTAELLNWVGRPVGHPVATVTTGDGVRDWTLGRLPAGEYRVTTEAEGYFPGSVDITVTEGQQVTGTDQTLPQATEVSGTIAFASGPGADGTATIRTTGGEIISSEDFTGAGPFTFWVLESGDYVIDVTADTYLPASQAVSVTAGTPVTGLDITLARETEVSGTALFPEGPGSAGTVYFKDSDGLTLSSSDFALGGGDFAFYTAVGGQFSLEVVPLSALYVPVTQPVTVTAGVDVSGLEINVPLAAEVNGTVSFEGPASAGELRIFEVMTGARPDTVTFDAEGDPFLFYLGPGDYTIEVEAPGYVERDTTFTVADQDMDLGALQLTAVRATHMVLVDSLGTEISEVVTTVSVPAEDLWFISKVQLAARDQEGRDDLFDLDGNLQDFNLSALKMDDVSPPRGTPVYYASENLNDPTTTVDFDNGIASFWMTNDAVEVLRIYLAQTGKAPLDGRIIVAFQDPQPTVVVLTADRDTLVADDQDQIVVQANLYDSANNPSLIPEIPVTFSVSPSSSGAGRFQVATTTTNANGEASAVLTATGTGSLHITCSVVINNRLLEVQAGSLGSDESLLGLTAIAGQTVGWNLALPSNLSDLVNPVTITAQLVDVFGNATRTEGESITFSADPPSLGTFVPLTALSDTNGRAVSEFMPSGQAGLVTISGGGTTLVGDEAGLRLRDVFVAPDPIWYNEPRTRQTFPPTDLTALVVDNTLDELVMEIPFASDWAGLQIHVLFETNFDAIGGASDPFVMPVNYGHDHRPDYALTTKYSADDYGDFRRWNTTGGGWEMFIPESGEYVPDGGGSQNIQGEWVTKGADKYTIRMPWTPFGGRLDSLRVEAYLTQEDGDKRSAFDSAPQDSTLNLTFDYENPEDGDWDTALGPVTLEAWSQTYVVKTDFPDPPVVDNITGPEEIDAGAILTLTAQVTDGGDGVGDVLADLSAIGGGELTRMYDDGDPSHGDTVADDGVYGLLTTVPLGAPGGPADLIITGFDASNNSGGSETHVVEVEATIDPIVQVFDPIGDDHGPNQPGTANLYYTYPTNSAFVPGGFDLTSLTIYEVTLLEGEMIAFEVGLVDLPDPADPGTADWNPTYAELNIEKIDILIDNAPGGATATLPGRQAAFQRWDAWDYAIIMDGWYKALIPSLGQNTLDSWRANALRTDQDIQLVGNPETNTVTAFVSKAALGDPTAEDIRSWDMVVCIGGHDFGGEEVLGGIRWVNESRSEWQFGGGKNEDRDSNLMDLLLVPGAGHSPGLPQEDILHYESPAALQRLANGETPVAIEMSAFEDTGPPVIDLGGDGSVVTTVNPIEDAPLALAMRITDDNRVDSATFRYRSTSFGEDGWSRQVPMGYLGGDLWNVDILPSWLDSNLVHSPVDSSRYLEFEITAVDPLAKTSTTPVTTMQIAPNALCRPETATLENEQTTLLQVDGSGFIVDENLRHRLVREHIENVWTGGEVDADTMGAFITLEWEICETPESIKTAQAVPAGKPLGVFRDIYLVTTDTLGGRYEYFEELPAKAQVSLHYPQDWVPSGTDENTIGLYEYNMTSNRWVLVGGNVTPTGNNVTATIAHTGTYGLFRSEGLAYDSNEVISGITISPNPFSPNGDGLYDETNISFYLSREATVTVEIYNIDGTRKRVLTTSFPYAGSDQNDRTPRRVAGLIWDGREHNGDLVPYGIYILRVIATYNQAGGTRSIRSNHSLAVIR